jgi:hypothetical protein
MRQNRQKQPARDGESIKIGNRYLDTIRRLAAAERKTQRVIVEEHLDLAFKIRRIPIVGTVDADAIHTTSPAVQEAHQ